LASEAFTSALSQASKLLAHDKRNYRALETKLAASYGLVLCEDRKPTSAFIEVGNQVTEILGGEGNAKILRRLYRLMSVLYLADTENVLLAVYPKVFE
jgi:hypothetical protein